MNHSIEPLTTSSPVKELKGPALFVLKGNNLQEKERKKKHEWVFIRKSNGKGNGKEAKSWVNSDRLAAETLGWRELWKRIKTHVIVHFIPDHHVRNCNIRPQIIQKISDFVINCLRVYIDEHYFITNVLSFQWRNCGGGGDHFKLSSTYKINLELCI